MDQEEILMYLNAFLICISLVMIIILIYKSYNLKKSINDLSYIIYKPLFPFVLSEKDSVYINMYYK